MSFDKVIEDLRHHCHECPYMQAISLLQGNGNGQVKFEAKQAVAFPKRKYVRKANGNGDNPMERECKKCHTIKPLAEFVKNPNCKHGVTYECVSCARDRVRRKRISDNPISDVIDRVAAQTAAIRGARA